MEKESRAEKIILHGGLGGSRQLSKGKGFERSNHWGD